MRLYPIAKAVKIGTILYRCTTYDNDEADEFNSVVELEPYLVRNVNVNGFYLTMNSNESYLKMYKSLTWGRWPALFKAHARPGRLQDSFGYHPTKLRALQVSQDYLLSMSEDAQNEHSRAIKTIKRMISTEMKKQSK